ncbi:cytochrome c biogenesis protein [Evansella caseinilytica]|uniref:Cytochrome c biogenesis protein n=1 Tax=Evansella caseinilytica TaxID=1503961 RepID=A0A1H3LA11_9BACI|nr:cytochrome c biogenesis protein ResB [Evansella caseinilytica]SDY60794.1 cytochrome c biogenesis protein [Evansella caseinilytica]
MEKVKCDCGHVNPYGTYLCESCGKPLIEDKGTVADMRYEGVARRSQTYSKTIIDKIWNFFSSVKVGIWIIILLLLASALGSLLPQEMYLPRGEQAITYYEEYYGFFGKLFYQLGFHNLYTSWWYLLLIAALGISLVICSLDRVVPLYRALKTQRVTRHEGFLKRQRLIAKTDKLEDAQQEIAKAEKILLAKKYQIRKENGNLLAEKGRFSRWGPYINHVGLIIFLIGAMLRFFPEMYIDDNIWVRDGEVAVIKGTDGEFFLRNNGFTVELYDEDEELYREAMERTGSPAVKSYETAATLLKRSNTGTIGVDTELEEVKDHVIRVNDPLTFEGYSLYQVDYKLNELAEFTFVLEAADEHADQSELADIRFTVDLYDPQTVYEFDNGFRIDILEYFPNFIINDDREPSTMNRIPDNPRLIFAVFTPEMDPEKDTGELSLVGIQVNEPLNGENDYIIRMVDVKMKNVTALTVRKDRTIPILIVGGLIFMVGLVQGSYWHHRRIWLQDRNGEIWVAAHANKNWYGLKKDLQAVAAGSKIPVPTDQKESEEAEQTRKVKEEGVTEDDGRTEQ